MLSAGEALERLRDGNRRFVSGERNVDALLHQTRPGQYIDGQAPFAVILGCSDSRVPVEIVFDQGLGDLFVIRVAGNIAAPSQIGSVEFAVERFGTRLVVVLGHTRCGAIQATLEALAQPGAVPSQNLRSIVERVRPAIEEMPPRKAGEDADALARRAVRANVSASAKCLRLESTILQRGIEEDGLLVLGAEYSLESGVVDFFDGLPREP